MYFNSANLSESAGRGSLTLRLSSRATLKAAWHSLRSYKRGEDKLKKSWRKALPAAEGLTRTSDLKAYIMRLEYLKAALPASEY
jgi:hypothetical protein